MSLALRMSILSNFKINGASGGILKHKLPVFTSIKLEIFCSSVSPEALFYWKLFKIGY